MSIETSQPFYVVIKLESGRTIRIDGVSSDTRVFALKYFISNTSEGMPIDQQRLIYAGKQLSDIWTIKGSTIVPESIIHLKQQLRGGSTSPIPEPIVDKDALFDELSKSVPAGNYFKFCQEIDVPHYKAQFMLEKENHIKALRYFLDHWKKYHREELEKALTNADIGGLCSIVKKHYDQGLSEASGVSGSTKSLASAGVVIRPLSATLQGIDTNVETNLDDTLETSTDSDVESGQQSSVIRLDKHQIEVRIPPSEKLTEKDVRVRAITQVPPELAGMLKEKQAISIICVGLEISSEATFSKPVKVTMPHSAIFTIPKAAHIGAYYRKTSDDSFSLKSVRCDVRERDLDVYLDHFSEWWIIAFITSVFLGKRLICTPHVPISTKMYDEHLVVLCIRDDNAGEEKIEKGYIAPVKGAGFSFDLFAGPLTVTCKADTKNLGGKEVGASVFRQYIEENIQFLVKTAGITKSRIFVEFILKQKTTVMTKSILCPMNLSGSDESAPDTLVSGATGSSASAAAWNHPGSTSVCGEAVSNNSLNRLAINVPIASYYVLSEKLGIEHDPAKNLLMKNGNDSTRSIRECLGTWKNRTGGSLVELRQILTSSELGGLEQCLK